MKISIIIPVYKVEQYLDECLQSVFSQTYKDLEIILIDDGSPDNCPQLCDKYARQDSRVQVIHKINEGAAEARNEGLRVATGEFIMFLDADDFWMDKDGLKKLVQVFQKDSNLDIVLYNVQHFNENTQSFSTSVKQYDLTKTTGHKNTVLSYLIKNNLFTSSAWIQMIKRDIIVNNAIFFEKGLFCEDLDWILSLWQWVNKVSALNLNMYCYRHRLNSTSNQYLIKQSYDYIYILKKWMNLSNEDEQFKSIVMLYLSDLYASFFRHFYMIKNQYRTEISVKLKQLNTLLLYAATPKAILVKKTKSLLGFNLTLRIFGIYGLLRKRGVKGLKLIFFN